MAESQNEPVSNPNEEDSDDSPISFVSQTGQRGNDPETQRRIRRLVMRGHPGRPRRRDRPPKPLTWRVIVPIPADQDVAGAAADAPTVAGSSTATQIGMETAADLADQKMVVSSKILDRLGAGRMDPFIKYPIAMDETSLRIVDDMFDERVGFMHPIREALFPVGLLDPASFYQMLANSALALHNMRHKTLGVETAESLVYHNQALSMVTGRLANANDAASDGMVGAIVGFAYYKQNIGDYEGWKMHISALKHLIQLRGGFETLQSNQPLRLLVYCNDLSGAILSDELPIFPLPPDSKQVYVDTSLSSQVEHISQLWALSHPSQLEIMDIFVDIAKFMKYFSKTLSANGQITYEEMSTAFESLLPLAHRLLKLPKNEIDPEDGASIMKEALRLVCILFLDDVKRSSGSRLIRSNTVRTKLYKLMLENDQSWGIFVLLKIWCLAIGMMQTEMASETDWFKTSLKEEIEGLSLGGLEDGAELLRGLLWYEELHTDLYRAMIEIDNLEAGTS